MLKINLVLLCFILAVFDSCKSKTDLSKSSWKSSGSDSLIKYIIEEKGGGQPARRENVAIIYQGWLDGDKLVKDTSNSPDLIFSQIIIDDVISEKIPIGSKGLISIS